MKLVSISLRRLLRTMITTPVSRKVWRLLRCVSTTSMSWLAREILTLTIIYMRATEPWSGMPARSLKLPERDKSHMCHIYTPLHTYERRLANLFFFPKGPKLSSILKRYLFSPDLFVNHWTWRHHLKPNLNFCLTRTSTSATSPRKAMMWSYQLWMCGRMERVTRPRRRARSQHTGAASRQ